MSTLIRCACPGCNRMFEQSGSKKYHSKSCRQKAYRLRHENPLKWLTPKYVKKCLNCGKEFATNQPSAKFHSTSCRVSYHQQMKRIAAKEGEL